MVNIFTKVKALKKHITGDALLLLLLLLPPPPPTPRPKKPHRPTTITTFELFSGIFRYLDLLTFNL